VSGSSCKRHTTGMPIIVGLLYLDITSLLNTTTLSRSPLPRYYVTFPVVKRGLKKVPQSGEKTAVPYHSPRTLFPEGLVHPEQQLCDRVWAGGERVWGTRRGGLGFRV